MNYVQPQSAEELFDQAVVTSLYQDLIAQLNKDFNLANEAVDFPKSLQPDELFVQLHEKVYRLIQYRFAEYLNLLYVIDVSETEVKNLDGSDIEKLSAQVAFLILKREWQKVWFRNKFS